MSHTVNANDPELGLFAGTTAAREIERLRAALDKCIEHMEWSTPQGEKAYKAAKALLSDDQEVSR